LFLRVEDAFGASDQIDDEGVVLLVADAEGVAVGADTPGAVSESRVDRGGETKQRRQFQRPAQFNSGFDQSVIQV
jgi:hypothetical protein